MNYEFDELAKRLVQSTTRRQTLKKLGVGLAGIALGAFGLAPRAQAGDFTCTCSKSLYGCGQRYPQAVAECYYYCSAKCSKPNKHSHCC
jgi:hypothetical protein